MASNSNNHNTHPEFDPNIRIKAEPGMDAESSASTSTTNSDSSGPSLLANIKVEPGLQPSNNRLPSLFGRRDLTLGGNVKPEKPRRIYTPNVNAQRLKKREDQNNTVKNEPPIKKEKGRNKEKHERGRDGRGRGRGKPANNLIQSTGVFSEGLADTPSMKRSGHGYSGYRDGYRDSGGERETLQRPKLSVPQKINKTEEEEKIKILLRDDFIADRMDVDESNGPISLPMFNEDIKPAITISQVLEKNAKSSNYILLQLPDCLPGLRPVEENPVAGTSKENRENETEKGNNFCNLNDLKEGMLGKLQILQSGKAQIVLGDNNLSVELGSTVSFRQDLIAAKINSEEQDLVNLGRVNSTLICSLDWQDLIKIL